MQRNLEKVRMQRLERFPPMQHRMSQKKHSNAIHEISGQFVGGFISINAYNWEKHMSPT